MLSRIWHHIAESNWINFIALGMAIYMGWQYVTGLHSQIELKDRELKLQAIEIQIAKEQARTDSEINAIAMGAIAEYVEKRLNNIEEAKQVGNAVWNGVRETKY